MNPADTISFNPTISAAQLTVIFVVLVIVLGWLAWRSTAQMSLAGRIFILACRVLLVITLFCLALNPGRWIEEQEATRQYWTVLADQSLSMETTDMDKKQSRWDAAVGFAKEIEKHAPDPEQIERFTFDAKLQARPNFTDSSIKPIGEKSDLAESIDSLLTLARERPDHMRGAIIMTDGRQTLVDGNHERAALRARAMDVPLYLLPLGGEVKPLDLSVKPTRRQFVSFEKQEANVSATVRAQGLGAIRPEIVLRDSEGKEIDRKQIELSTEEDTEIRFSIPAQDPGVHLFTFSTDLWPEEKIPTNNSSTFTVTVLDGTTKIFMAEGAPYWDSKFLAQMIREQDKMEIVSVTRLAEERFFRIATGESHPTETEKNVFPSTREEMDEYDLIVFGKGVENFLDEKRLALLSEYVRDQGGSVLFTRGKPYRTKFQGLEFLEPVTWGARIGQSLRLQPTTTGEAAGLFGDLLPGADSPVWEQLPTLTDSHQCLELKPFTEIMLKGMWTLDGRQQTVPILMSRRYGRGMTLTLNADGLWQWDFFPSDKGVEGQYDEFWSQLIQWAITFSEFLPGHDLSLHLDQSVVRPGDLIQAKIGHRGQKDAAPNSEPAPALALYRGEQHLKNLPASKSNDSAARWEASLLISEPGSYRVEAIDLNQPDAKGASLPVTILPPPSETEDVSADPDFIQSFIDISGGKVITPEEIPNIVAELSAHQKQVNRDRAVWVPLWDRWYYCLLVLFIAAVEWFTRRRAGLS